MGTWFLVSEEGNDLRAVTWKRVCLIPRRAMRTVEWRGNVFSCIRGRQCVRWSVVVTWFLEIAEDNVLVGVAWRRVSLYPRKTMRTVECGVNVFRCTEEGNAFGAMAWNRGSLYPGREMRSGVWRGYVDPCNRGGQCARRCGVETYFLGSAKGNAQGVVAWKRGSFCKRRAIRSVKWRGIVVPFLSGGQCARGMAWKHVLLYPRRAMR